MPVKISPTHKMERILVGMSGGVDSSAAALLLKEAGYDVTGMTMRLKPRYMLTAEQARAMDKEVADAAAVCEKLGIAHIAPDFSAAFEEKVIRPFIASYKNGETPNPCFLCNQTIKFGIMLDRALENGFDKVATGHYARVVTENGRALLMRSPDKKDQSYFLSGLTPEQLKHVLIPLTHIGKDEARKLAEDNGLPVAHKPDSQEICFIPGNDYIRFLERFGGELPDAGDFVSPEGEVLGRHSGIHRYTVGQRKGLGITFGEPRFVTAIDPEKSTVTLGRNADCMTQTVKLCKLNLILRDRLDEPVFVEAKVRYAARPERARLVPTGEDTAILEFDVPQRAVTPGQVAAMYQGDYVFGSGIICR